MGGQEAMLECGDFRKHLRYLLFSVEWSTEWSIHMHPRLPADFDSAERFEEDGGRVCIDAPVLQRPFHTFRLTRPFRHMQVQEKLATAERERDWAMTALRPPANGIQLSLRRL